MISSRRLPITRALCLSLCLSAGAQAAELFAPGAESDPRLRSATYLAGDKRHFSALTELLQMNPSGDFTRMPTDYQWLLAQAYLNFGMKAKAEQVYRNIALNTTDAMLLTNAQLRLAEFSYERGYYDEARTMLYTMREKMPRELLDPWQDLLARVLMADGRYTEAVEVLTDLNNANEQTQYTRYNLGVGLINTDQIKKGRDVIDRVGRMRPYDVETLALRDRANLSLGWHFLKSDISGSAKTAFYRIRSVGPFSNRALLGLGWAELDPGGTAAVQDIPDDLTPFSTFSTLGGVLRPGFLNKETPAGIQRQYRLGKITAAEQEALRRAMVTWVELISRDPLDPAVQEAWLAIPYSLDRLGAHTEALQYYEQAVERLEENRKRLNVAMASIKRGVMVETIVRRDMDAESGWGWKLKDLPDTPETYYLQSLLAEHRFQEALKNYRDVRLMARSLDGWKARLLSLELAQIARGQGDETPEVLFKRAKLDWSEPWKDINVVLREETSLAPPGNTQAPFEAPPMRPIALLLDSPPQNFNGARERITALKARIANLRELSATAGAEQAKLLENMAVKELEGQKKAVEKYLVEARFALARLYDRELRKAAAEAAPVQEKGSLLQRFLGVFNLGATPAAESPPSTKGGDKK